MEEDPFILQVDLGTVPYWINLTELPANPTAEDWDKLLFSWPWGTNTDIEATE